MSSVTLVTAFFDIDRERWHKFKRSDKKYLEYFKHWSHINNDLIVYIEDSSFEKEILSLRKKSKSKTFVVLINNIFDEDARLYSGLKNVDYKSVNHYRLLPENPECISPEYNYIMMMKYHLLKKAITDFSLNQNIAWIDFGFDHGGENYSVSFFEDFSINYKKNKITMFSLFPPNEIYHLSPVDLILKMETVIQGSFIIGPVKLIEKMCSNAIDSQILLNKCGIMDDDQITLLMSYYLDEKNYEIVHCDWHCGLYYLRDGTIIKTNKKTSVIKKIRWYFLKRKAAKRVLNHFKEMDIPK